MSVYTKVVGTPAWKAFERALKIRAPMLSIETQPDLDDKNDCDYLRFNYDGEGDFCPLEAAAGTNHGRVEHGYYSLASLFGFNKKQADTIMRAADDGDVDNRAVMQTRKALVKLANEVG